MRKLTDFVLTERWRGKAFFGYTDEEVMWEIATHSTSFTGCAYVENDDGVIEGIVTAVPLSLDKKQLYVRNILCTSPTAFRRLVNVLIYSYGKDWTLYARRRGKIRRLGTAEQFNRFVKE